MNLVQKVEQAIAEAATPTEKAWAALAVMQNHRLSHSTPGDAEVRKALEKCRDQFDHYAGLHIAKNPPDKGKAVANMEFADMCRKALATPSGRAQGEVGEQKPVAWLYQLGGWKVLKEQRIPADTFPAGRFTETPLYAAPPAQDQGEGEPKPSFPPMPSGKPPHGVYG